MQRLFAGTPWDRPPSCDRCGQAETECACPPVAPREPVRLDPATQTARLRLEKRAKGKVVTVVANLDPAGNDLPALAARLKIHLLAGSLPDPTRLTNFRREDAGRTREE
jgi:translation initiation factor 1